MWNRKLEVFERGYRGYILLEFIREIMSQIRYVKRL